MASSRGAVAQIAQPWGRSRSRGAERAAVGDAEMPGTRVSRQKPDRAAVGLIARQ
jgi:hypothetical protein